MKYLKTQKGKKLEYEVEKIINHKRILRFNKEANEEFYAIKYLIKWVGYNKTTWEPEENLCNCPIILKNYWKKVNKKPKDEFNLKNKTPNKYFQKTEDIFSENNDDYSEEENNKSNISKSGTLFQKKLIHNSNVSTVSHLSLNKNNNDKSLGYIDIKEEDDFSDDENIKEKSTNKYNNKDKNENLQKNDDKNNKSILSSKVSNINDNFSHTSKYCYMPSLSEVKIPKNHFYNKLKTKKDKFIVTKKEKSESISSSFSISLKDSFLNETNINNNNSQFIKDDNDFEECKKSVEISQIKVPTHKDENIYICGKIKNKGRSLYIQGTSKLKEFPKEEIFNLYEEIIKSELPGKIYNISELLKKKKK